MAAYRFDILSCVFPPEPIVSAQTSAQIAQELAQGGHAVRVITTFPSRPAGRRYAGYRRLPFMQERAEAGYAILRCFSFFSPHSNMMSRFLENISLGISSGLAVLFLERSDIIYANTWPIFAQGILWLMCRLRGIPFVLSVQDIYPESLIVQSRLRHPTSWIFKTLRFIDTFLARHSDAIIVISEQFRQFYIRDRGLPAEKVHMIPNWIDETQLVIDPATNDIRRRHGVLADAFLVVYGGNIGPAAGVENVIQAFECLIDRENIYLLIAGDGPMLERCRALARAGANRRIVFHNPWLADETSKVLCAADLLILPTQGEQSLVSVPSKLISYMLAGRPVLSLAQSESELAKIIQGSNSGWVIPPGDPQNLSKQIAEIATLPQNELRQRGEAGRDFARQHYSKSANLPKVIEILERACRKGRHDPPHEAG